MKRILMTLILATSSMAVAGQRGASCESDSIFTHAGWQVHHPAEFSSLSKKVLADFKAHRDQYVYDTEGTVYSGTTGKMLKFVSYDGMQTPQDEMYGDLVIITNATTDQLIELRWYDHGKKQLVYNRRQQACATDEYPYAENALF